MKEVKFSLREMAFAALFGAGTAAGAYVVIPVAPVPITLQTLFLYVAAGLLGERVAALSQVVYVLLGVIGLPVFAGGKAGLGILFGPTGGYLLGFILGAYAAGKLMPSGGMPGTVRTVLALAAGTVVIYVPGVLQLCVVAKLSPAKALTVGVLPFLLGDGIKIAAATLVTIKLKPRMEQRLS